VIRIAFILPGLPKPIGGFKFIYRIASELSNSSHVSVFHQPINNSLFSVIKFYINRYRNKFRLYGKNEFKLNIFYTVKTNSIFNSFDIIYILSWHLLIANERNILIHKDKIRHIVMDFPGYMGPHKEVLRAWQIPIQYYSISNYLNDYLNSSLGIKCKYLGCLIPNIFKQVKGTKKMSNSVLLNYSSGKYKNGQQTLFLGLELAKLGLNVFFFGREKVNSVVHPNIKWHLNYSDEMIAELFMKSEVFVSLSEFEGFGLPALEALYYRCLLITTDNFGNRDYLNSNCMIIINNVNEVVEKVIQLLNQPDIRKLELRELGFYHASNYIELKEFQRNLLLDR